MTMSAQNSGFEDVEQQSRSGDDTFSNAPNLFFSLPRELRDMIYISLLTNPDKRLPTFGCGSGIDIAVLMLNKCTYSEALPILYSTPHKLTLHDGYLTPVALTTGDRFQRIRGATPPRHALEHMHDLSLAINFATTYRPAPSGGQTETNILHAIFWEHKLHAIGTSVLRSETLNTLTLSLWNERQCKTGVRRLRSPLVMEQMRAMLRPFAYLPRRVTVLITGFDTSVYVDLFEEMRNELAEKEMPVDETMREVMPPILFQYVDPRETMLISGHRTVVCPEWKETHAPEADMSRLFDA